MDVPPVGTAYQLMVYPTAVALRFDVLPAEHTEDGAAVTLVGEAIPLVTVTVTAVLEELEQLLYASA
jgi:hypothetical protein